MMKEQILKRSVSCILTLCMLFLMLPVISLDANAVGGEDVFQLDADCQVLKFVDEEVFNAADHVARLPEEETLDSYAFLNRDGTKTVYFLNENAKYYDATGAVKEKNIDLVAGLNAYTVTQNDVQLSIPADPASGIDMTYAGYDISLVPQGGSSTMVQRTDNSVGYINYYGKGTALLYTPTYSGIKEDILLAAYTGISSFTFLLNTDGLRLYSQNERYFLAASADSDMQIRLGDVVAYDAFCNMHRGTMTATAITEGQQYLLTISVDESFLTDANTAYPVIIDPTLTVSDSTHGSNAIEDAPLFSGYANTNHGSYIYDRVGYVNSNYGTARTVIRPTGLLNSSIYQSLSTDQITSATFHIRDASGSGSATVKLHALNNSSWTESNVTWNNVGSYDPIIYAQTSVGGNTMASFDLTWLVSEWITGATNPNCGFILVNSNESSSQRALIACEGSSASAMPYVTLTYEARTSEIRVNIGSSTTVNTSQISETITAWSSANTSIATVNAAGRVTGVQVGETTVTATLSSGETVNWTVYVTLADGIYYLQNVKSGNYLGATDGGISVGTTAELQAKLTTSPDRLHQNWRIDYVGNGYHTIRPLHRMRMGLAYNSRTGGVSLQDIGEANLGIDPSSVAKWKIYYDNGGYVFQHFSYASHTMYPTGSATAVDTAITTGTYSGSNNAFKWTPQSVYSGAGLLLYDTVTETAVTSSFVKYIGADQSLALRNLGITYSFYTDTDYSIYPTWTSSNTAVATVNASNGQVTGLSPGVTTITLSVYEEESDETFTKSYTLVVLSSVYDYIVNVEYGQSKTLAQLGLTDFINQANPSGQALTWYSSNEDVAVIDNTSPGAVCAVSYGETTITATASNSTILAYTLVVPETIYYITNFYDTTAAGDGSHIQTNSYIDNIETAIKYLNTAYYHQLKDNQKYYAFVMNGDPTLDTHTDHADFTTSASYDPLNVCEGDNCYCSNDLCSFHHKNVDVISTHFYEWPSLHKRQINEIIVYWTNRNPTEFCEAISEIHTQLQVNTLAKVVEHRPVIHMIRPYGNTEQEILQSMCITLTHEMSHVFELDDPTESSNPEHYTEIDPVTFARNLCIMDDYTNNSEFFANILSGEDNAFCSACESRIRFRTINGN